MPRWGGTKGDTEGQHAQDAGVCHTCLKGGAREQHAQDAGSDIHASKGAAGGQHAQDAGSAMPASKGGGSVAARRWDAPHGPLLYPALTPMPGKAGRCAGAERGARCGALPTGPAVRCRWAPPPASRAELAERAASPRRSCEFGCSDWYVILWDKKGSVACVACAKSSSGRPQASKSGNPVYLRSVTARPAAPPALGAAINAIPYIPGSTRNNVTFLLIDNPSEFWCVSR